MNFLKSIIRSLVSDKILGRVSYYRSSKEDRDWSGPFNGQAFRKKIYLQIVDGINFSYVLETGTFRGVTTELIASTQSVPIFSIEISASNFGYASARLASKKNVKLFHGNSVNILHKLFTGNVLPEGSGFFYLDAHWGEHLPLLEELNLIFENAPSAIVMIDDFKVPDDDGYLYDDYGAAGSLTMEYIKSCIDRYNLESFFPNCSAIQETGKKRGVVVLSKSGMHSQLAKIKELVQYSLKD